MRSYEPELILSGGAVLRGAALNVEDGRVASVGPAPQGAVVPEDDSPLHLPWARHHAELAREFGPAEQVEPIYLRIPDAEARARA